VAAKSVAVFAVAMVTLFTLFADTKVSRAGSVHEITAQATDAAGNVSDVSAVLAITVDIAAPTITVKIMGTIAPNSNLVATFSEAIAKGTGGIVIKESDGTTYATLGIQNSNITIAGTDNKTLTINPSANLESGKSYHREMASGVLTDVAGNNFAGIDDSSAWSFSAASLSTTVGAITFFTDNTPRSFGNSFTKCCNKITIWRYRAHNFYCDCRGSYIYCNIQNSRNITDITCCISCLCSNLVYRTS
jgi:hypothetical protein